jgi:hypothetical protein
MNPVFEWCQDYLTLERMKLLLQRYPHPQVMVQIWGECSVRRSLRRVGWWQSPRPDLGIPVGKRPGLPVDPPKQQRGIHERKFKRQSETPGTGLSVVVDCEEEE